jgi:hypothetical protein
MGAQCTTFERRQAAASYQWDDLCQGRLAKNTDGACRRLKDQRRKIEVPERAIHGTLIWSRLASRIASIWSYVRVTLDMHKGQAAA